MNRAAAILTDLLLCLYVLLGMVCLRHILGGPVEMISTMLVASLPFALLHIAALQFTNAYDFSRLRSESDLVFSACAGVLIGSLASFLCSTVIIVYYLPEVQVIGRSVFAASALGLFILLPGWRIWVRRLQMRRGELASRVLLVGSASQCAELESELAAYSAEGHEVVAVRHTDAHNSETLADLLASKSVNEVILAGDGPQMNAETLLSIVADCSKTGATVHLLPGYYEALVGRLDLYAFGGLPMIGLRENPLTPGYAVVKRSMDIGVAIIGLIISAPILALAALAVRLDSKGPVFYRQERCGLNGRIFTLIKLRSMMKDAEADSGPVFADKEDVRVTRVGRFLRDRRLDELPQLWNVLKGDMSLVGPRPERPHFTDEFSKELPLFPLRMRVRPGLSSLSHVWGRYDSAPGHRLLYDLAYMNNVGLLLDIRILVDTIKVVLTGHGAR